MAKVYKRKVNSGMAVSLIKMYRAGGTNFQHIPTTVGGRSREEAKLRYWGLVEEELERRPDGGRAGWWRVTHTGRLWVLNRSTIPKYAYIYDARLLDMDGEPTSIRSALGEKFDYEELMGPAYEPPDGPPVDPLRPDSGKRPVWRCTSREDGEECGEATETTVGPTLSPNLRIAYCTKHGRTIFRLDA